MRSFEEYDWPMKNPDHKPFKHQVATVEFLLRNKRAFVLSDIGTGKTLCPLWAADILMTLGRIKRVLIVTPLSTVNSVWSQEIFENMPHRSFAVAHGSPQKRLDAINSNADFVIINHDGIKGCFRELIAAKFDIVVIDELTAFKNMTTDRTDIMYRIANKATAVWGMTGAMTPNSPTESYSQAKIVNPMNPHLPRYYTQFKNLVVTEVMPHVFVPTANAMNHVHAIAQPAIRFERDKCLDLPPVLKQDYRVEMSKEQGEAYEKIKKELYLEYEEGTITAVNAGVKFSKLLQVSAGSVKDDLGKVLHLDISPKFNSILESFEESGRTKLIVVSAFKASVERLYEMLLKEKIKVGYVHGGVKSDTRGQLIHDLQKGDLQVLVLQPQAMAHGITLTAANTIVWQSFVASGEVYNQMNGRITRAGQTRKQYVRHLISSEADRHIVSILNRKISVLNGIMSLFAAKNL